jgi:hypothetical protein
VIDSEEKDYVVTVTGVPDAELETPLESALNQSPPIPAWVSQQQPQAVAVDPDDVSTVQLDDVNNDEGIAIDAAIRQDQKPPTATVRPNLPATAADFNEIDVTSRSVMNDVSTLTTLTDDDVKYPPPAIPNRQGLTSRCSTGTSGSSQQQQQLQLLPDLKAQVNSRSIVSKVGEEEEVAVVVDVVAADSNIADAVEAVAKQPPVRPSRDVTTPLPSYKSQCHPTPWPPSRHHPRGMPSPAPMSSSPTTLRQISNNSGNTTGMDNCDHIPMVDAILVPAERLQAKDRQLQRRRLNHSSSLLNSQNREDAGSGGSTLTTAEESGNHPNNTTTNNNDATRPGP